MVDIRSSQSAVARTFDLHSQAGVTQLLVSVRNSALGSEVKNELRDLVFQFSNSGDDDALRSQLERKITEYQLVPTSPTTTSESKPLVRENVRPLPFGSVRPRPAFTTPHHEPAPHDHTNNQSATVATNISTPTHIVPDIQNNPPSSEPEKPAADLTSIFTPHTPPVLGETTTESHSLPQAESEALHTTPQPHSGESSVSKDEQVALTNVSGDVPPADVVPISSIRNVISEPSLGSPDLTEKNLNRIREIKAFVNEKIGNPVNLVDIDNVVGREYMSALLDAMKKINSGAAGVSAMDRLEASFASVMQVLERQDQMKPVAGPIPSNKSDEATVSEIETKHISVTPVPAPKIPDNPPQIRAVPPPPPHPDVKSGFARAPFPPTIPTPAPETSVTHRKPVSPRAPEQASVAVPYSPVPSMAVAPITQTTSRPLTPLDLPDPTALENSSVKGDPLFTREVDDGLNQLLSEWSLFKKSGLFGTGPKGVDHPLFKKIATLQIPLLLAGRFEGATQEIKQSITDYMNGWRYEQGIIYEQGETFEHYLRRVIRHIIDLQKKRIPA